MPITLRALLARISSSDTERRGPSERKQTRTPTTESPRTSTAAEGYSLGSAREFWNGVRGLKR